ncbi:MAG: 1-deoxy-D-xylulose-5-phosphate reductoisomerase [Gammaproteobacteria bacterium]|nr:1-deoxy-D-xylulose-5-phosphate reductoisomerase [Gammaproteobacteria bacterium]MCZ6912578.1 1-deoxy-D-xylulose-5-phosphate reductoisomerase [Pseudomonadota bacterium]
MKGVSILGSTGSVGCSTLDVIARNPDAFRVVALTARKNHNSLLQQCIRFEPDIAVLTDNAAADVLRGKLQQAGLKTTLLSGAEALVEVARLSQADYVMAAIVGAAGLLPTLAAAQTGKRVLLANKESLVLAGHLLMEAVANNGATLIPIDSEHNAIFQCLPDPGGRRSKKDVRKLWLTASGGPFLNTPVCELEKVTPEQACAHPNWDMGDKISVDSATMMNKGLELIEASHLFDMSPDDVEILIHPQSIVHSLVEYRDGSVLAQLGNPDMRTPIAHALAWPERMESGVKSLDLVAIAKLEFQAPDTDRFPCLALARAAAERGGTAPAVLNAANEVAVQAFLDRRLPYTEIAAVIGNTIECHSVEAVEFLETVIKADQWAREKAGRTVNEMAIAI